MPPPPNPPVKLDDDDLRKILAAIIVAGLRSNPRTVKHNKRMEDSVRAAQEAVDLIFGND